MSIEFTASATSSVVVLCARAIIGAIVAILLILILTSFLRHDNELKRILFILLVSVILLTSTVLFMTALNNVLNVSVDNIFVGATIS